MNAIRDMGLLGYIAGMFGMQHYIVYSLGHMGVVILTFLSGLAFIYPSISKK